MLSRSVLFSQRIARVRTAQIRISSTPAAVATSTKRIRAPPASYAKQFEAMLSPAASASPGNWSRKIWNSHANAGTAGPSDSTPFLTSKHRTRALRRSRATEDAAIVAAQASTVAPNSRDDHAASSHPRTNPKSLSSSTTPEPFPRARLDSPSALSLDVAGPPLSLKRWKLIHSSPEENARVLAGCSAAPILPAMAMSCT
mmetsp:Transcript_23545/g.56175  ORF Transcript_23545/g.56175 Transcript_23545/m.56175 type:complete len:200 (-) Transcript_23545:4796-5395(-)